MRSFRQHFAASHSRALHQHQMTAEIERWSAPRKLYGVFKGGAIGHQRRRCQHTLPMRLYYSGIHIARKAEIVGVNNEVLQLRKLEDTQPDREELFRIRTEIPE